MVIPAGCVPTPPVSLTRSQDESGVSHETIWAVLGVSGVGREAPSCEPQEERHHLTPWHHGCSVGQDETPCDVDGAALGSEIL